MRSGAWACAQRVTSKAEAHHDAALKAFIDVLTGAHRGSQPTSAEGGDRLLSGNAAARPAPSSMRFVRMSQRGRNGSITSTTLRFEALSEAGIDLSR